MPKVKLTTQADVDALPYSAKGKQTVWWSRDLDHFGVRVGARDKVYIVGHRINRKWRLNRIGRAGEITVQRAIRDAKVILGQMAAGVDPAARARAQSAHGMTLQQAWALYQEALGKLGRSPATLRDYTIKLAPLADWLDRPLVAITRAAVRERHTMIGERHGTYMANGTMRTLRAIWRRARREHPELPEAPTASVDFYRERGRTAVITDWPAWWRGVQQIPNPVRRDFYVFLAFSGCRSGEVMRMATGDVDLDRAVVRFPVTKTVAFALPLSDVMLELLARRVTERCRWVFPSDLAESGHIAEAKLTRAEAALFATRWTPHTLRHSWTTIAHEKVGISDHHQRLLVNHAAKRGDAHGGYIHPDLEGLRASQQRMTDWLRAATLSQ